MNEELIDDLPGRILVKSINGWTIVRPNEKRTIVISHRDFGCSSRRIAELTIEGALALQAAIDQAIRTIETDTTASGKPEAFSHAKE